MMGLFVVYPSARVTSSGLEYPSINRPIWAWANRRGRGFGLHTYIPLTCRSGAFRLKMPHPRTRATFNPFLTGGACATRPGKCTAPSIQKHVDGPEPANVPDPPDTVSALGAGIRPAMGPAPCPPSAANLPHTYYTHRSATSQPRLHSPITRLKDSKNPKPRPPSTSLFRVGGCVPGRAYLVASTSMRSP